MKRGYEASVNHGNSITVPQGFMHLARSETCENELMKHPEKPTYGVQFHPEKTEGDIIIPNFLSFVRRQIP